MNYGCQSAGAEHELQLDQADEGDRLCIQLYDRVASGIAMKDVEALEIGSGRGGGASYVARYRKPRSVVGVDFSGEAVAFCSTRHRNISNLAFQQGDAEKLGFADNSFDVVINVESSHCYGNVAQFLAEVARVLRTGGHFLFADLRECQEMAQLRGMIKGTPGFKILEEEEITADVLAAMEADDARKREKIRDLVPAAIQPLFNEFAGVRGGKVFENLNSGKLVYHRFVVLKE
jgi:ubiquinone/menaquinone biosynthesis C-methylase UbiE